MSEPLEMIMADSHAVNRAEDKLEKKHKRSELGNYVIPLQVRLMDDNGKREVAQIAARSYDKEIDRGLVKLVDEFFVMLARELGEEPPEVPEEGVEDGTAARSPEPAPVEGLDDSDAGESDSDKGESDTGDESEDVEGKATPTEGAVAAEEELESPAREVRAEGDTAGAHAGEGAPQGEVDLIQRVEGAESDKEALNAKISELSEKNSALKRRVKQLTAERNSAREDLKRLKQENRTLSERLRALREEVRLNLSSKKASKLKALQAVFEYMKQLGRPATVREIQEALGWKRAKVFRTLACSDERTADLTKLGLAKRVQRGYYGLTPTGWGAETSAEMHSVLLSRLADFVVKMKTAD